MGEGMSSLLLIGAELGAILVLGFIMLVVYFIRRRSSDKRYVANFIADHKGQQAERREAMKSSMQLDSLLTDEDLEKFLDKMNSSEKYLYKHILNMYLGFDRKCLPEIRTELSIINDNWINTVQKSVSNAAELHMQQASQASGDEVGKLNKQIEELTADNNKISGDLAEAMETMEDIVKEYSLMYAGQENQTMDRLSDDYDKLKEKSDSHKEDNE